MIKTIVTGGSGFIGSYLVKKLGSVSMLKHDDIVNGNSYNADLLFFLSTYGNLAHHVNQERTVKANVTQLLYILNKFFGYVIYMSSSSVMLPVQTPYSRTKRAAEEILQALPELKSCIVRPYSVTGVGEQKEHLIPTLIRSCMEGELMPFDPNPVHDFVDVEDIVNALIVLADNQTTGIVELGSGIPHTNQQVREIVEEACGKKANVKETDRMRVYDNDYWCCRDPFALQGTIKTLSQSVGEMVEAYKNGCS